MPGEKVPESIKRPENPIIKMTKENLKNLNERVEINLALTTWKSNVPPERKNKVKSMIEKWEKLVGTEYHLWWTLGTTDYTKWIDCSHFVAYSMWLPEWQKENTWSLDAKYKKNEVPMKDAKPWDLLMWPWHYDPDVKREIGHVEMVIWRTQEWKLVTLWASWISNPINKYTADGKKLPKHNCVWYTVREPKDWMRILRA